MEEQAFNTPEDAALASFPRKYCSAVACRSRGDHAYVVLNTGTREQPYLYGVHCVRHNGEWVDCDSSNAAGWLQTSHEPDLGMLAFWDDAPARANWVTVEFNGHRTDEPVIERAYLVVWWDVPQPSEWPRVVEFR